MLSYGVCSAAVSGLWYAGRNYDILFSFVVGMIVGLLNWLAEISAPFARISSLVCAFIVAFLANAIQSIMVIAMHLTLLLGTFSSINSSVLTFFLHKRLVLVQVQ